MACIHNSARRWLRVLVRGVLAWTSNNTGGNRETKGVSNGTSDANANAYTKNYRMERRGPTSSFHDDLRAACERVTQPQRHQPGREDSKPRAK
jgi:hypothetical protein